MENEGSAASAVFHPRQWETSEPSLGTGVEPGHPGTA